MRLPAIGVLGLVAVPLAGCQSAWSPVIGSNRPPPLAPVHAIVNGIKCELAETFHNRDFLKTIVKEDQAGADIAGVLVLTSVVAKQASGEAGGEIPFLGVTIGPSGSLARTATATQSFEIKFNYDVDSQDPPPDFCTAPNLDPKNVALVEGNPFLDMLRGIALEYAGIEAAKPQVRLGSVAYGGKFEVKQEASGGFKLKFLFLSAGTKLSRAETDAHSLSLTFNLKMDPRFLNQLQSL